MKTVLITGATGMVGSMVYAVLKKKYRCVLVYRDIERLKLLNTIYGDVAKHRTIEFDFSALMHSENGFSEFKKFTDQVGGIDACINCVGIVQQTKTNSVQMMLVNSILPQMLSIVYKSRLIHLSTDGIFDGLKGLYTESDQPFPQDMYSLTKLAGEPYHSSLVLRTSIIGPELSAGISLVSWLQQQKTSVKGFKNYLWNGITTRQFGKLCDELISYRDNFPKQGVFHIYGSDISKYELLLKLKKKYQLAIEIRPVELPRCDRRLRSRFDLCQKLAIPSIDTMIADL